MTESSNIDLSFSLTGKVALVTGGGSGIGSAIASALAAKGATVGVIDINEAIAKAKAEKLGGGATSFVCDVSNPDSAEAVIAAAEKAFGRIDIMVNSAGIVQLAPAEELPRDFWQSTIAVNLSGTFYMSQAAGKAMIRAGRGGKIINMASQAGTVAIDQHVSYCASKFGVIGLSKVLAAEWGKYGINVNTISPTVVLTDLGRKAWDNPKGEALKARIPAGRFALPEEVAAAAVFLASNGADMITGADLLIDGGYTIV
ncbi:GolD/DthD family dehydrogenase [Pleomorphomonas sp. NRK KF1]|uniref:GolD/DthD family dehydrogenase n=1 Tax=Pleomorphomonas sp. NRK KF1 TaxID=2943000 RepID=UPI002042D522|nr:D-threitol dehydrogenase [Pleomorphomonas sp. NRK KF1]MCM5553185.1 D-threitol dehydrogenase [Pleomorphomonas sp. NRK KF1]